MSHRRLTIESLEHRELLSAQNLSAAPVAEIVADAYCQWAGPIDSCGQQQADSRVAELWDAHVAAYLRDDLWLENRQYDAGHYLMVPLHAAFQLANAPWQRQFADQFRRFAETDATTRLPAEISLGRIQYLYLGSRFVSLATEAEKFDLIPSSLIATLYESVDRLWQRDPAWQWGRAALEGGIRERLDWKLHTPSVEASYHRVIIDFEQFVFAIAADLRAYERATRAPAAYSPVITEVLETAEEVHRATIVPTEAGGWLSQPGAWTDHPTYAYAGEPTLGQELAVSRVPGIAEDTAHANRWPLWLRSLQEAAEPGSGTYLYYESLLEGLEKQFVDKVLVPPTEAFPTYRLTNYMDGRNGVYRYDYPTHPLDGYGPYELSGTLHDGWWGFLETESTRKVYREVAAEMPFVGLDMRTFTGPGTSRPRHAIMAAANSYQNDYLELTTRLASLLGGWKPDWNRMPQEVAVERGAVARVPLVVADPDGDPLLVSAQATSLEMVLQKQLELTFTGDLYENWGGRAEKWLRGRGAWYFLTPDGRLWQWNGSSQAEGLQVARFDPKVYEDPRRLYQPAMDQVDAEVSIVDGLLSVTAPSDGADVLPVVVTAADGRHRASRLVWIRYEEPPYLSPVGRQVIDPAVENLVVDLSLTAAAPVGEVVAARVLSPEYVLDEQLGLSHDGDYDENWGGRREKWLEGLGNAHYFLTPDGALYRWDGASSATGVLVAMPGSDIYEDPSQLFDAAATHPVAAVDVDGLRLTVTPQKEFAGDFFVEATLAGQRLLIPFSVGRTIETAEQAALPPLHLATTEESVVTRLPDQDRLDQATVYRAEAESLEYVLDRQHAFRTTGNLYRNWGGRDEWWILDGQGQWYFVTPDASLYRWDGQNGAAGIKIASFGRQIYENPERLYDAQAHPVAGMVRLWGNLLEIDPAPRFAGNYVVEVIATHALGETVYTLPLEVNAPPEIGPVADQSFSRDAAERAITLDIEDPDDQQHMITVQTQTYEAFLDGTLALWSTGNDYHNWGGTHEKWMRGGDQRWYFIRPDGQLFLWDGGAGATGASIAQLSRESYENPALLYDADQGSPLTMRVEGSLLVFQPQDAPAATYIVTVQVSDGISDDELHFALTLSDLG